MGSSRGFDGGQHQVVDGTQGDPIRVLLVEDHPGFRLVLRALLETDDRLIVIGDVGSADDRHRRDEEAAGAEQRDHDLIEAIVDAGERGRTSKGTKAHWDLNPARLPIPPRPRRFTE